MPRASEPGDLNRLRRPDADRGPVAIVIGGSIAGSLAAGVLAGHVDRVVVLDRDRFPSRPGPRKGVPHGDQFHALLERGRRIIEHVFPGFTDDAVARGAVLMHQSSDLLSVRRYGPAPRFESSLQALLISRELIEWTVREHALRNARIQVQAGTEVVGLTVCEGRATGVRYRRVDGNGEIEELGADFVVDASGRQSRSPAWLQTVGYPLPEEVTVNAHWGYTSCFVEVPDHFDPGFLAFSALPRGAVAGSHETRTRGATLLAQDGERRWILTAIGSAGDHPPADEAGLRAFVSSLEYEELTAAVAQVKLIGAPKIWRNTVNRLRRYDEIDMPDRYLVIGDAFAAFNPVYGQGMTVAAMAAENLAAELDQGCWPGLTQRVQARLAKDALFCWWMATGADYRVDGVIGPPPPPGASERSEFMDRVEALTSEDTDVYIKFWETTQLLRSTDWLEDPALRVRIQHEWDRLGRLVGAGV